MILYVSSRWEAKGLWLLAALSDRAGNPSNDELVRKARATGKARAGESIPVDLSEDDVRWLLRASRLFDADPGALGSSEKFGKIYQFGIASLNVKLKELLKGVGPRESRSIWHILSEAVGVGVDPLAIPWHLSEAEGDDPGWIARMASALPAAGYKLCDGESGDGVYYHPKHWEVVETPENQTGLGRAMRQKGHVAANDDEDEDAPIDLSGMLQAGHVFGDEVYLKPRSPAAKQLMLFVKRVPDIEGGSPGYRVGNIAGDWSGLGLPGAPPGPDDYSRGRP